MERKTIYMADDFASINKHLKELETKPVLPANWGACPTCLDRGFIKSISSGRWKVCPTCLNALSKTIPF
jgi:hypothetical protein